MSDNDEEFITDNLDNNEDITYEDILPEESASNITSSESSHSTARSFNRIQRGPKITSSVWSFLIKIQKDILNFLCAVLVNQFLKNKQYNIFKMGFTQSP